MSYEKDQTYLKLAEKALEEFDGKLRQADGVAGVPVISPTPWGDPQINITIITTATDAQLERIKSIVKDIPIVFRYPLKVAMQTDPKEEVVREVYVSDSIPEAEKV